MSFAGISLLGDAKETSCSASAPITPSTAYPVMDSGYHLLLIQGYSRTKDTTPTGKFIYSQPFNIGGYSWIIGYYPNGHCSKNPDYITFYLRLEDGNNVTKPVMAQFEFSFIDQVEKQESSRLRAMTPCDFRDGGWGYSWFMRKKDLERSKHLKNDSFMVRCDIVVTASQLVVAPPQSIQQHLGSLLLSGEGADVTFKVGDEEFMAHRCVLAARSPVFKSELFGPMKEGITTSAVRIDDMEPQVFKLLLSFIYSDSVPDFSDIYDDGDDGDDGVEDEVIWRHLFVAADIYDLPKLRLICEEKLHGRIHLTTVVNILVLAEQHHCQGLKEACSEFLNSPAELKKVAMDGNLDHLRSSCPSIFKELTCKLESHKLGHGEGSEGPLE